MLSSESSALLALLVIISVNFDFLKSSWRVLCQSVQLEVSIEVKEKESDSLRQSCMCFEVN